jgi:DNA-binding response OmpR family regulator
MKKIMTVDDEADIRTSIKSLLKDEGFEVESAVDGKDCLNQLKKTSVDLILLDVMMPGLTSKEIIEGIKKNKEASKTKIIFLTVVRFAESTQKDLMKGNVVDFIEKPFDNAELIKRIKKALNIK